MRYTGNVVRRPPSTLFRLPRHCLTLEREQVTNAKKAGVIIQQVRPFPPSLAGAVSRSSPDALPPLSQDYTNEGATGKTTVGVPITGVHFTGTNSVSVASGAKRVYVRPSSLSFDHELTLLHPLSRSSAPRVCSPLSLVVFEREPYFARLAGSCSDFDFAGLKTSGGSAGSITNVSVKVRTLSLFSHERNLTPCAAELLALSGSAFPLSPLPALLPFPFLLFRE